MDKALNTTLDDLIKNNKAAGRYKGRRGPPRGRGGRASSGGGTLRGTGRGAGRPSWLGVNARPSSLTIAKSFRRTKNFPWKRDLLEESLAAVGLPRMDDGTKLNISNLDRGVSNDDIRELFSELGEMKRYAVHFDKFGQPSGSAEVVYAKRSDAFAALKRYHNVQLDGRPMRIEVVNSNSNGSISARVNIVGGASGKATRKVMISEARKHLGGAVPVPGTVGSVRKRHRGRPQIGGTVMGFGDGNGDGWGQVGDATGDVPFLKQGSRGNPVSSAQTNRGFGQRSNGGSRNGPGRAQSQNRGTHSGRGRGRGRGGRGKRQVPKSAEELDKELENYHAESMQIS